jgi:hypothetical protein
LFNRDCHQTIAQILVDSDTSLRRNCAGHGTKFGEQFCRPAIAVRFGEVRKTRQIYENEGSWEAHFT